MQWRERVHKVIKKNCIHQIIIWHKATAAAAWRLYQVVHGHAVEGEHGGSVYVGSAQGHGLVGEVRGTHFEPARAQC